MAKKTVKKGEKKIVKKEVVKKEVKVNPKLDVKPVIVCKEADGTGGKKVMGIISADKKSVTTLAGVTFAIE